LILKKGVDANVKKVSYSFSRKKSLNVRESIDLGGEGA